MRQLIFSKIGNFFGRYKRPAVAFFILFLLEMAVDGCRTEEDWCTTVGQDFGETLWITVKLFIFGMLFRAFYDLSEDD